MEQDIIREICEILASGQTPILDLGLQPILAKTLWEHKSQYAESAKLSELHQFAERTHHKWLTSKLEGIGFSLFAALNGYYVARFGEETLRSRRTLPLLVFYDRRIAVEFEYDGSIIYIITDEYWGIPYLVYNYSMQTYFSTNLSTIPTEEGLRMMIAGLHYWTIHQWGAETSMPEATVSLLVGGNDNIGHFIWNYLGGVIVYKDLLAPALCLDVVSLSDNFQLDHALIKLTRARCYLDLSSSAWPDKHRFLSDAASKTTLVRLTGFGLLDNAILQPASRLALDHQSESVNVILTVRSTSRSLINQRNIYLSLSEALYARFGDHLNIIIDAPCSQSSGVTSPPCFDEEAEVGELIDLLNRKGIRTMSLFGRSLLEQADYASSATCILSYISGGNMKFLGLAACPVLLMSPDCDLLRRSVRAIDDVRVFYSLSEDEIKSLSHLSFFYDPAYYSYSERQPMLIVFHPDNVETIDPAKGFHSGFKIESGLIIQTVIASIDFHRSRINA